MIVTQVRAQRKGREYVITADGSWYRLMLDESREFVVIYTKVSNQGIYRIGRFGGELSPASIRDFFADASKTNPT